MLFAPTIAVLFLWLYAAWLRRMRKAWLQLPDTKAATEITASFTVVIPFRNEAQHLQGLFRFFNEHAPHTRVVWVNDHSTDGGERWLSTHIAQHPQHTLLHCREEEIGKKAALRKAIETCTTEWMVTLDADVQLRPDWLMAMCGALNASNDEMMVFPINISGHGTVGQWQQCEMLALTGLAGATAQLRSPMLANGAHMAFKRNSYLKYVAAHQDSAYSSGDDMFLLHYLREQSAEISYAAASPLVATVPAEYGAALWQQRLRWAGKMSAHSHAGQRSVTLTLALGNAAPWLALLSFHPIGILVFALLLVIKFWVDLSFCNTVARRLRIAWSSESLFGLQFVYLFYLMAVFIASRFHVPTWKGRVVSLRTE